MPGKVLTLNDLLDIGSMCGEFIQKIGRHYPNGIPMPSTPEEWLDATEGPFSEYLEWVFERSEGEEEFRPTLAGLHIKDHTFIAVSFDSMDIRGTVFENVTFRRTWWRRILTNAETRFINCTFEGDIHIVCIRCGACTQPEAWGMYIALDRGMALECERCGSAFPDCIIPKPVEVDDAGTA